jgi:hypothetical protein
LCNDNDVTAPKVTPEAKVPKPGTEQGKGAAATAKKGKPLTRRPTKIVKPRK